MSVYQNKTPAGKPETSLLATIFGWIRRIWNDIPDERKEAAIREVTAFFASLLEKFFDSVKNTKGGKI